MRFQCQRMVVDYIKSKGYDSYGVPIDQKSVKSVKGFHCWYVDDLAKRKKISTNEERKKKLESLNENILSLKQKRDLLESMIVDLKKDSDEFTYNVEHETKLISVKQLIYKSNALKRAAVEKQEELDECLKEKRRLVENKKKL